MRVSPIDSRGWLDSMHDAVKEMAVTMLGVREDSIRIEKDNEAAAAALFEESTYFTTISLDEDLQVRIVSDIEGCLCLSGALMGLTPKDAEVLSPSQIADAMGELVNIVAGILKTRLADHLSSVNLGLPNFLKGRVRPTADQEICAMMVGFNEVKFQVVILRNKQES
ncbi:MAG: chemotaxis protein CheX [Planctomycetes bacterium]|nr:chemotaxis protein CheX [Planctomycetota bacterium]